MGDRSQEMLVDRLCRRGAERALAVAFTFRRSGTDDVLTYGELDLHSRAVAARLGNALGQRVLLLFPPGLEFVSGFFGCLYAGAIGIPVPPPDAARAKRTLPRLQAIVRDAEARYLLAPRRILEDLLGFKETVPEFKDMTWLEIEGLPAAGTWRRPPISEETVAYLQYTSGSTSEPKGVVITHAHLSHHLDYVSKAWDYDETSRYAGWMPHFHDYGLVEGIIHPVGAGIPSHLTSPLTFLKQPVQWLRMISEHRATHSAGPDFAYAHCVRRIGHDDREGLDLSCWRTAGNAAETVRRETLDAFTASFGAWGFRREAFYPSYGLAEATLVVTAKGDRDHAPVIRYVLAKKLEQHQVVEGRPGDPGTRAVVGCGRPVGGMEVRIVDPESLRLRSADEVGEIWVRDRSVAAGYWRRPEVSREVFAARLVPAGDGPFLRTGDLGFMKDGELFVTGRLKDLILIGGQNRYPQDIEWSVEHAHAAVRHNNCCAAFAIEHDGKERLVVLAEVERNTTELDLVSDAIREAVGGDHGVTPFAISLLSRGGILKTSSGKVRRRACRQAYADDSLAVVWRWEVDGDRPKPARTPPREGNGDHTPSMVEVRRWLRAKVSRWLRVNEEHLDEDAPLARFGLDSMKAVELTSDLEAWLGRSLSSSLIWNHPTINSLARHLTEKLTHVGETKEVEPAVPATPEREPLAIIGMGCRVPGADDSDAFWSLLQRGEDAIREIPQDRWDVHRWCGKPRERGKVATRFGGFLERLTEFDPDFFGISPREALRMDPQQRLALEVTWEALENAGLAPGRLGGTETGMFLGVCSADYLRLQYRDALAIDAYVGTGGSPSIVANRVSYTLDFRGPSLAVDTACSSSLVAVHLASQSLRSGECRMALAGGTNVVLLPELSISLSQAHMLAEDGRCKAFDRSADGFVRSEGCGIIVLKRLSDALADGNRILALLRGSAVNQDGRSQGLTAPNGVAQEEVVARALRDAAVAPSEIGYVEAHGTGTHLGDPIEVKALAAVLQRGRTSDRRCALGSVKANIGHLEAAAGIVGLIKTVFVVREGWIPPQPHLREINPLLELEKTPFVIHTEGTPWTQRGPRRAGVSSFGFGGTNAHVVLEDARVFAEATPAAPRAGKPAHLCVLSARTEQALRDRSTDLAAHLLRHPDTPIGAVARTLAAGRDHFEHRLAIVTDKTESLRSTLESSGLPSSPLPPPTRSQGCGRVAFLFTGQGASYVGMGHKLFESEPVFRAVMERAAAFLDGRIERPLLSVLDPGASDAPLHEARIAQPALMALQCALAELWRSWGIVPDVVMGHSLGEYAAAVVAKIFDLEDGLELVSTRARLMEERAQRGRMAAILTDAERVVARIAPYQETLAVAAFNGPQSVVISGREKELLAVVAAFEAEGVACRWLPVEQAFHSPLMSPLREPFEHVAASISYRPSALPLVSTVTGRLLAPGETLEASSWVRQLTEPVQFVSGMRALRDMGCATFLELGPHPTLVSLGRACFASFGDDAATWVGSLRRNDEDQRALLEGLGELYVAGADVAWENVHRGRTSRRPLALPTYPFQRRRLWIAPPKAEGAAHGWEAACAEASHALCGDALEFRRQRTALDHLNRVAGSILWRALHDMGATSEELRTATVDALVASLRLEPGWTATVGRWLSALRSEEVNITDVSTALLDACEPCAGVAPVLDLMLRCGKGLAGVLRGELDPLELLLPGGAIDSLEPLYRDTTFAALHNRAVSAIVSNLSRGTTSRPFRILEVGGGTGATTGSILEALRTVRCGVGKGPIFEYVFTDVGEAFVRRAQQRFADVPGFRSLVLDLESDAERQGVGAEPFDVVVAANVLHATTDLRRALRHVASRLRPGGALVLWEVTRPQCWIDLTFGLTQGWRRANGDGVRGDHPLLSSASWSSVLTDEGFTEVTCFPEDDAGTNAWQQNVIMARRADSAGRRSLDGLLHDVAWREIDPRERRAQVEVRRGGSATWVIVSDVGGVGRELATALRARGEACVIVEADRNLQHPSATDLVIEPGSEAGAERVLSGVAREHRIRGIVHLEALDGVADPAHGSVLAVSPVIAPLENAAAWIRAVATGHAGSDTALWLMTRGAFELFGADRAPNPFQASLWGLGRVMLQELRPSGGGLLDLDPEAPAGELARVADLVANASGTHELALRGGRWWAPRLEPVTATPPRRVVLRSASSYVITGGLGGLGLLTARWMIERGCRHLGLVSLHGLSPTEVDGSRAAQEERLRAVRGLEALGAIVDVHTLDVGNPEWLSDLRRERAELGRPAIAGVVHAAGIARDQRLASHDLAVFRQVLRPKLDAARWLDAALDGAEPLEFIVYFSSAAAVLGLSGGASYAAANAFLDALALEQRQRGIRALSIALGPVEGAGLASRDRRSQQLARLGIETLEPTEFTAALDEALIADRPYTLAARLRPRDLGGRLGSATEESELRPRSSSTHRRRSTRNLHRRPRDTRKDFVHEQVAHLLMTDARRVLDDCSLRDLGFDSIMAVQLQNELEARFGVRVRIEEIVRQSVSGLAESLETAECEP